MTRRHLVLLASLTLGAAACSSLLGPDGKRVIGYIQWVSLYPPSGSSDASQSASPGPAYSNPMALPALEAPDTVAAGERFRVVVRTYGATGCWVAAGSDVHSAESIVSITPFDRNREGVLCTHAPRRIEQVLSLSIAERGIATIRLHGRTYREDGAAAEDGVATIEKSIVVR